MLVSSTFPGFLPGSPEWHLLFFFFWEICGTVKKNTVRSSVLGKWCSFSGRARF